MQLSIFQTFQLNNDKAIT